MSKGEATSETADIIGTLGLREPFQAKHAATCPQSLMQTTFGIFLKAMAVAALDIPREDMKHVDAVASMVCYSVVGRCPLVALQNVVYELLVFLSSLTNFVHGFSE